jgi:FkbM family methyltransferase
MLMKKKETKLPNNKAIFCLDQLEANLVYDQIQEYFKHGIEIYPGDTVVDVGANIGLFALGVYWQLQGQVKVYSFEPIPTIFQVLEANVQRHSTGQIQAFPYGLSQSSCQMTFAYHPHGSALSTAYPEGNSEQKQEFKRIILRNFKDAPGPFQLLLYLPPFLRSWAIDALLNYYFQAELVECQLKTLSEVIEECSLSSIDLLKIDVEKSELDVLLGLSDSDWPKIKSLVIEIHDRDDRLTTVKNLLQKQGFGRITVEQEPLFQGSTLYNVYALR